jgi:hypothetical protein
MAAYDFPWIGCRSAGVWFVDLIWRESSAAIIASGSPEEGIQMKFMFIVKSAHSMAPSPALLEAMHKLANREIKAGRMLDNGGLMPIAQGAQVRIIDGQLSVLDGPFVEAKEVVGGYAVFELHNKEEAVASAVEFMQLHKDFLPGWEGTCELRAFAPGGP